MKSTTVIKRAVAAGVALAAAASLAACGGSNPGGSSVSLPDAKYAVPKDSPAWKADKSTNNTLTWYVNADWWNKSWGQDLITKQIAKDLNLKVVFSTGDDTKLNTYFASGDLPDIVTTFDANSQAVKTAPQWALPLNDLAAKYDPYFNKVASKDTLNWYKAKDGKTYGYPSYSNTPKDYASGMIHPTTALVIRKDVLAKLDGADFTTPQGFEAAMKAIKEKFPDLIPFGFNDFSGGNSSLDATLQDMLGVPITKGGKFYDRQQDKDYLIWLKTLRQVHADGNISDDSFADDADGFKEKVSSGKYATMLVNNFVSSGTQLQTWASSHPDDQYVAIDGMESTEGHKPTLNQAGMSGWSINFVSKKAKNPAKAIQVFEYLLSDYGQMLTNFGIEGQTYKKNADGTVSWTDEANKVRLGNPEAWQKKYRMGEFVLFGHDRYKALNSDSFVPAIWQMQKWGQPYLKPQYLIENIDPDASTPESRALTAIRTNWTTTMVSLIRAGSDSAFDSTLAQYQKFLKDNNIDAINKIRNEKIALNAKNLDQ